MFGITEFEIFAVAVILTLVAIHGRLTSIKTLLEQQQKLLEQQRADRFRSEAEASRSYLANLEAISARVKESTGLLYIVRNVVCEINESVKITEPIKAICDRLKEITGLLNGLNHITHDEAQYWSDWRCRPYLYVRRDDDLAG
jgi:hypothetical protein